MHATAEVADAVAADAADALDEGAYFGDDRPADVALPLTDASVRQAVEDYLGATPQGVVDFESLAIAQPTGTHQTARRRRSASAVVRPPVLT